jgi:hypothetical protein
MKKADMKIKKQENTINVTNSYKKFRICMHFISKNKHVCMIIVIRSDNHHICKYIFIYVFINMKRLSCRLMIVINTNAHIYLYKYIYIVTKFSLE